MKMTKFYSIINITPWGTYELPSVFTDKQKAYNHLHKLQTSFPHELYKVIEK